MAANILDVCDDVTVALTTAVNDITIPVDRLYLAPYDLATDTSRHVWVFPAQYQPSPATRGEDEWVYTIGVVVAERYTTAGEPTPAWLDDRVTFSEQKVYQPLYDLLRTMRTFGTTRRLWLSTAECRLVYDPDKLSEKKLFWSEFRFEVREILDS